MRVLAIYPGVFDKGGIARYGRYQIQALREAFGQANVSVASLMGRQDGDLEDSIDVSLQGVTPVTKLSRARFAAAVVALALRERPNVVLTGLVNLGPLGWLAARAVGAQLIQNIYGLEVWSPLSKARREALRRADVIISDCEHTATVARSMGLATTSPLVVWDCVDTKRFRPQTADWNALEQYGIRPTNRFRLLFLGRIAKDSRYKGFESLLELLGELGAKHYEVVIAGTGDFVEPLRRLALDLGVADSVAFTGSVHENDLAQVYSCADAFYLSSEVGNGKGEGLPLTPIEAMACGVPVVVGDQDGSREILNGSGGICCAPRDLASQATYLRRLRLDTEFHTSEKRAARKRVETTFGYDEFARKTVRAVH